ncbi:hypothetical protein ACYSNX_05655 [Myroides sp. LJL115]
MKKTLLIGLISCMGFLACDKVKEPTVTVQQEISQKTATLSNAIVPYKVIENYFVLNTIENTSVISLKIESKQQFDTYFSIGRTMSEDSKATPIDFDKYFVIVIIGPVTNQETVIKPISLKDRENHLEFIYSIESENQQRSFSIHPFVGIVVDKQYNKDVKFIME